MTAERIIQDIKSKKLSPVYILEGTEPFYIDYVTGIFEKEGLQDDHNDFNVRILYGQDTDWKTVIQEARNIPMFGDKILVVLKEAQNLREFNELHKYLDNPNPQCTVVLEYKGKNLDKRTALYKSAQKKAVVFTSNTIKENELPIWIQDHGRQSGLSISTPIAQLLSAYLGNDLKKIDNEFQKIKISRPDIQELSLEIIEEFIGISREYNVYEFTDALFLKQYEKLTRIINYFTSNPKNFPEPLVIAAIYNFIQKVYLCHYSKDAGADRKLGIFYSHRKATQYISLSQAHKLIKTIELVSGQAVGINYNKSRPESLLKELTLRVQKILN